MQLNRPELGRLSGVFVEIPVEVSLETRDQRTLDNVRVQEVSDEDIEEAVAHVERLAAAGARLSLRCRPDRKRPTPSRPTERAEKLLVRQRYS